MLKVRNRIVYRYRTVVGVPVVYPHDRVATAPITKTHIQNLKNGVYRMHYSFHTIVKSKIPKLTRKSGPAVMILVTWEARPRMQFPEHSAVPFSITALYAMHFSPMPILIRNRSFEVFPNLTILLLWAHFMLIQLCLASNFLFSGVHFSKP